MDPSPHTEEPSRTPRTGAGSPPSILWFDALSREDVAQAGGKGANLGELTRAGLPVPPGFVITAAAFHEAMRPVRAQLRELWRRVDPDDARSLAARHGGAARRGAPGAPAPSGCATAVLAAYHQLRECSAVAVRSSATSEDTAATSFAGMHETFTNVVGDEAVLDRLRGVLGLGLRPARGGLPQGQGLTEEPAIAVVVQEMVDSARSGVMFTVDPATGDTRPASSSRAPSAWARSSWAGRWSRTPTWWTSGAAGAGGARGRRRTSGWCATAWATSSASSCSAEEARRRVLDDVEVLELARWACAWSGTTARPRTSSGRRRAAGSTSCSRARSRRWRTSARRPRQAAGPERRCVSGPGRLAGPRDGPGARAARRPRGGRLETGEILVAPMTSPDWVPTLRRAAAIITDSGGMTCHAAIVSRELRMPCVVGTRTATTGAARRGGGHGGRRHGARCGRAASEAPPGGRRRGGRPRRRPAAVAAGRARGARHAALREPGPARAGAARRRRSRWTAWACCARSSCSPKRWAACTRASCIAEGRQREFVERMAGALLEITRAFQPRPVVYRTTDFRTNEFRGLEGGAGVRAHRGQPDDRLPRLLPLPARAGGVPAGAGGARPGARGDAQPAPDDSLRAHGVGAGGVPGGRGRKPAGTPARAGAVGDGGGALRRLPHPRVRAAWASRACPSAPTT